MGSALLLAGLAGSASAAKLVGKDGKVYACYQVKQGKGKAKGSVRLVTKNAHCRRGERKLNWAVAGPPGPKGEPGSPGAPGAPGAAGAPGAPGGGATQVTELVTRIDALESTLQGVTNDTLTKALATVNGITNAELTGVVGKLSNITGGEVDELVASLPLLGELPTLESTVAGLDTQVGALCTQADTLTDQVNGVGSSVGSLINNLLGSLVGAVLGTQPAPPPALPAFTCPTG